MDLKSLRAFKKVCETGSISKAADALYITQPGLSKSMARLEAECGHQLFERTSKGVMLTPYGRALYARIDQLVAIMDEIESETLSLQRSRKLKVASTIGVLLYTGMAFTDDFEAAFPEIELFVEEGSDRRVEEWLSSGAVEIGFLAGPVDRARYDAWLFSRHRHVLDVREGDSLAGRPFVEHRDLDGRIVALLSRDYRPYENNVRWLSWRRAREPASLCWRASLAPCSRRPRCARATTASSVPTSRKLRASRTTWSCSYRMRWLTAWMTTRFPATRRRSFASMRKTASSATTF